MYAYPDSKCVYGYMIICGTCLPHAPPHVDILHPITDPPNVDRIQLCEMCKKRTFLLSGEGFNVQLWVRSLLKDLTISKELERQAAHRYEQLYHIHHTAKTNTEVAQLVRECVKNWGDSNVKQGPDQN